MQKKGVWVIILILVLNFAPLETLASHQGETGGDFDGITE